MAEKLSAEQVAKVASACTGLIWVHGSSGNVFKGNGYAVDYWNPKQDLQQRDALASRCAVLIRIMPRCFGMVTNNRRDDAEQRFIEALATGNTDAIEALLYELLENNHG